MSLARPDPPVESLELSIVIPAYQESSKIVADIRAAAGFLRDQRLRGEILLVDDGSRDDTAARARGLAGEVAELTVISHPQRRGKGAAVRTGVLSARGAVIMFADAGLCVPYAAARVGLAMLAVGTCDLAHGSRRQGLRASRPQPAYRRVGSWVYAHLVRRWMRLPAHLLDTQCGFKLYRRAVAHELYGAAFTEGFMFDVEIIGRALRRGYVISEFAVPWRADRDSRYHPVWGTLRNLGELLAIQRRLAQEPRGVASPAACVPPCAQVAPPQPARQPGGGWPAEWPSGGER